MKLSIEHRYSTTRKLVIPALLDRYLYVGNNWYSRKWSIAVIVFWTQCGHVSKCRPFEANIDQVEVDGSILTHYIRKLHFCTTLKINTQSEMHILNAHPYVQRERYKTLERGWTCDVLGAACILGNRRGPRVANQISRRGSYEGGMLYYSRPWKPAERFLVLSCK